MWDMTAGHFYKPWSGVAYLPGERGEYDLTAHIIFALKAELIAMRTVENVAGAGALQPCVPVRAGETPVPLGH